MLSFGKFLERNLLETVEVKVIIYKSRMEVSPIQQYTIDCEL
jgi:hypothetical protein